MADLKSLLPTGATYNSSLSAPSHSSPVAGSSSSNGLGSLVSSLLGGIPMFGSIANGIASYFGAKEQRKWEEQQQASQQEWNEKMMDKENQFNVNMWNMQNEYNDPSKQYERLLNAGFNPMFYGPDGTGNAEGMSSAQALGYERASNVQNPLATGAESMFQSSLQAKSLQKDLELKNAQIDEIKERTNSTTLDNEWKDKTMDARVQSEELSNSMTKETIENVKKERKQIDANIKKIEAETETEYFRMLLVKAQEAVQKATEKQILEMLPYQKLLAQAQTEAQKASAMASYYNALTQKGLLDAGYIEHYIDGMIADNRYKNAIANSQEAQSAINNLKAAVRTGHIWSIEDDDWFLEKMGKSFLNDLFANVSILAEAITGPIAGLLK